MVPGAAFDGSVAPNSDLELNTSVTKKGVGLQKSVNRVEGTPADSPNG